MGLWIEKKNVFDLGYEEVMEHTAGKPLWAEHGGRKYLLINCCWKRHEGHTLNYQAHILVSFHFKERIYFFTDWHRHRNQLTAVLQCDNKMTKPVANLETEGEWWQNEKEKKAACRRVWVPFAVDWMSRLCDFDDTQPMAFSTVSSVGRQRCATGCVWGGPPSGNRPT